MTDVTLCTNSECPIKDNCYRFHGISNRYHQPYQHFQPLLDDFSCFERIYDRKELYRLKLLILEAEMKEKEANESSN